MAVLIPVWEKAVLNIEEAAAYVGMNTTLLRAHAILAKHGRSDFPVFEVGASLKVGRIPLLKWVESLSSRHMKLEIKEANAMIAELQAGVAVTGRRGRPRKKRI